MDNTFDTSVVVVGGGPVGLALAGDLGWRGVPTVLLEQSDGVIRHPKMDGIDLRVMEFCRRWGIVDEVRTFPFPKHYPQDMVYLTSLTGYELGRESFASPSGGAEVACDGPSPESRVRCPQTHFDRILRKFAQSFSCCDLRYRSHYAALTQDPDGVTVEYESLETGARHRLRARYLVACDGGNSVVREQVGIPFEGPGLFNYTTSVMFRSPDLFALHDKRPAYRHLFITPEGIRGSLSAINGRDEWRAMLYADDDTRMSEEEVCQRLREIVGCDFDYEILSILHWARRELVAATYRAGRVLLAGDAAHVTSPTGGFGMNTGIKDAVDLAWKLEAVLNGWGGERLLESYTAERRPAGARAVREASGNWLRMQSVGEQPNLLERSYEGALLRHEVGRRFSATMLREWYKLGIDLGYVYRDSPICHPASVDDPAPSSEAARTQATADGLPPASFSDGVSVTAANLREWQRLRQHLAEGTSVNVPWKDLPAHEVMVYRQTAEPGARAPHAWLSDGRSTLDLYGKGFTLLRLDDGAADVSELVQEAKRLRLPLSVVDTREDAVRRLYRHKLTLVRPDGHVAWLGSNAPKIGFASLLRLAAGH